MKITKELAFNTLIKFSKNSMTLGYIFLAFALFPFWHEIVAVLLDWQPAAEADFELNKYFYYNCVCIAASLFFALSAGIVLRFMTDE